MSRTDARDIVLYDGDCGVCRALKDWAEARDAAGRLRFEPLQTADLPGLSPGLTREEAKRVLNILHADGTRCSGARAVFETLRRLPGAWGVVGAILATPPLSWLAEPFYRLFARYRGRVSWALGLDRCQTRGADRIEQREGE